MSIQQRKIVVVNHEAMMQDKLYRSMKLAPKVKIAAMQSAIDTLVMEREAYEDARERIVDGVLTVAGSPDIKHVQALAKSEAFVRLLVALKVDPRSYIYPQSNDGGKTDVETSNLKAYKKAREVAEVIWSGASKLENVAKVFTVCAYRATQHGVDVLDRAFSTQFLRSSEFRTISSASEDLWNAIDEVRARSLSSDGGAQTQASQMIRTLVALKSATDVREGRAKHTRIHADGRVLNALMRRFGQVTDVAPDDASDLTSDADNGPEVETFLTTDDEIEATSDQVDVEQPQDEATDQDDVSSLVE